MIVKKNWTKFLTGLLFLVIIFAISCGQKSAILPESPVANQTNEHTYLMDLAVFDTKNASLDPTPLKELTAMVMVNIYTKEGMLYSKTSMSGLVYDKYVFSAEAVMPHILDPKDVPMPPQPPGMTNEEYNQLTENFKNSLPKPSDFATKIFLQWEGVPSPENYEILEKAKSDDEELSKKLNELKGLGIVVFERIKKGDGNPIAIRNKNIPVGEPSKLNGLDMLFWAGSGYDEKGNLVWVPIDIISGSYTGPADSQHGFRLQGSVTHGSLLFGSDLGSPVFAIKKSTLKLELVGVIVFSDLFTGLGIETRAFAVRIDYILNLLTSQGSS